MNYENYVVENVHDKTIDLKKHCNLLLMPYDEKTYKQAIEEDAFGKV